MNTIRRSLAFSMADKYVSQILLIATTAAMARILTPAETGLYMTANAVILLADNFRSFGVGVYIVQEQQLDRALVRSAFTVTLALSLAMGAMIYLCSASIADFYAAPELRTLLALSALGFLAVPFSSPIMALLQRDMAFRAVACINMATALAGSAITITLGLKGFGPVSYIWGFVGASFVMAMLAFASRPQGWIFLPSFNGARRLLSFSVVSSLITVINMLYDLLPRLAFGKILGFDAVGLYARAINVCQLPDRAIVSVLNPVVLPAFAAQARAGGSLKQGYLHGLALMLSIQWPALILLSLLANPTVDLLLGPQWGAVPPLVRLMALANMALAPAALTFPVLVSAGRIGDALRASLISLPPSAAIVIGASFFSLEAVAASLLVVAPLQMLVAFFFIRRAIGLTSAELAQTLRGNALLALGCALAPALIVTTSPTGFDLTWTRTLLALAGSAAGWLAALIAIDHPAKQEIAAARAFFLERAAHSVGRPHLQTSAQPTSRRMRS
jgi:O-antigen/teichoic acid export membrane protein